MARSVNRIHVHHTPETDDKSFRENKGKLSAAWNTPEPQSKRIEAWRVEPSSSEPGYTATMTFSNEKG